MLSKNKRLNLKISFNWVRAGQKNESDYFKIFFRQGENQEAKVGIALKKENFKLAVDRNRARRLTSKAFENIYDKLPSNLNIVVMPKAGVLQISSDDLTRVLNDQLSSMSSRT